MSDRSPFQRGLFFLSSVSALDGVIEVMSKFFIELFNNSLLLRYHKEIIVKEVLDKASRRAEQCALYSKKIDSSRFRPRQFCCLFSKGK